MHDLERCPRCGKLRPTIYGEYIEGVTRNIPQAELCLCEPASARSVDVRDRATQAPPVGPPPPPAPAGKPQGSGESTARRGT
ncbi:MAG: hypothetical protein U0414_22610 [Polyangiaceae bacterium]